MGYDTMATEIFMKRCRLVNIILHFRKAYSVWRFLDIGDGGNKCHQNIWNYQSMWHYLPLCHQYRCENLK